MKMASIIGQHSFLVCAISFDLNAEITTNREKIITLLVLTSLEMNRLVFLGLFQ